MSIIQNVRACPCGRCNVDAYADASRIAQAFTSSALWCGGMRAYVSNELGQLVAHGCLFWIGRTPWERWIA